MAPVSVRIDRNPSDDRHNVWPDVAVDPRLKPKREDSSARMAFQERQAPKRSVPSPAVPPSDHPPSSSPTRPGEPRLSALIWAVLVCGALRPFVWMVRCRCCWRGRCRTVIGQHHSHLRVLQVCPVCDAARPIPDWLQPSQGRR